VKVISFDLNSDLESKYLHSFISLQDKYFTDELFIPMFKESLYAVLNTDNPFFSNSENQFFLVEENGTPIARAFAAIDKRRSNEEGQIVGNIGYFECPNDQELANLILENASSWLRDKGATIIHGPMDLHIYNNYRFMSEGYNTTPFISEPRNPKYYPALFEGFGFVENSYWRSWQINPEELNKFHSFLDSVVSRRKNIHGIEMTPIDTDNIEESLAELYDTALDIFSQNYGYSEISKPEFVSIFSKLKDFLAPGSFQIARNAQGQIVGFVYGMLDLAEMFIKCNGDYSKLAENSNFIPKRYIYHTFGVIKDLRFSDITARLSHAQTSNYKDAFPESIAALTTSQKSIIERIKKPNRYYKMYEYKL
jgi:hypothetical protein